MIDFVFVPGDNANHGEPEQYRRIADQWRRLRVPYRCIPGDHDFEPGDLRAYAALPNSACPFSGRLADRRCRFLDIVSHGTGGPDFLHASPEAPGLWQADLPGSVDASGAPAGVIVRARLTDGRMVSDKIETSSRWPHGDATPGTDAWTVAKWPDHGFVGTRLGPNKGGRKW